MDLKENKLLLDYGFKDIGYLYKRDIKRFYAKYKSNPYPIFIYENVIVVGRLDDIFLHNSDLYGKVLLSEKEDYDRKINTHFRGDLRGYKGYDKPKKIYPIKIKDISYCVIK